MEQIIMRENSQIHKNPKKKTMKRGKWFCIILMTIIIAQWLVFYLYSRINSVLTSFQYFDGATETFKFYSFSDLFTNYKTFFNELRSNPFTGRYIWNGYLFFFVTTIISEFSVFIAFYLYKKCPFSGVMLICLMLPSTLASMANPLMFKYFIEKAFPVLTDKLGWTGNYSLLFSKEETALTICLIMTAFLGFPGSMLFYVGQFGRTPKELVEAAQLDGITFIKEFWYIAFPSIFSMWSLGHLTILTGGLTALGPGYALYAEKGYKYGMVTLQYDILIRVLGGDGKNPNYFYPYSAAINMVFAIITIAGLCLMKKIFDKVDPQAEY